MIIIYIYIIILFYFKSFDFGLTRRGEGVGGHDKLVVPYFIYHIHIIIHKMHFQYDVRDGYKLLNIVFHQNTQECVHKVDLVDDLR